MVKAILKQNPELLNSYAHDGFTPIGLAALCGNEDVVAFLVQEGADVRGHSYNAMMVTPLHSAVSAGNLSITAFLLEHGADVDTRQQDDCTPLHIAVHNKDQAIILVLLEFGADPLAVNEDGLSPLTMAEQCGATSIAELLRNQIDMPK